MDYLNLFRMPRRLKISSRSSSITNAFVNSIIPMVMPTSEQVKQALTILGMDHDNYQCAYCGDLPTEWDHLRPLVIKKKPTGYISEIGNLVPSCGKCNQSKGNKPWDEWMPSNAKLSPKTRGIKNLEIRMKRLQKYVEWQEPTKLDFDGIAGKGRWQEHWENCEKIQTLMKDAQSLASEINKQVDKAYSKRNGIFPN